MGYSFGAREIERRKAYDLNPKKCRGCDGFISRRPGRFVSETLKNSFCSKSCAAKFNNTRPTRAPRKKKPRICVRCRKTFYIHSRLLCPECKNFRSENASNRKKGESSARNIRSHSRYKRHQLGGACVACGYDIHVEVCHIKPVSEFPDEAMLGEINALWNLVVLCPNHHWEFDSGLISREQVATLKAKPKGKTPQR